MACVSPRRSNSSRNRCAASRMTLSAKLGAEAIARDRTCQNLETRTNTIVLASAIDAAPLKLAMSMA